MMRIALDCRTLLERKTGDRTYMMNLVSHLPRVAPENEYHLLLHRDPAECAEAPLCVTDSVPNVFIHVLRNSSSRLWTALSLPRFAGSRKVDLIHVQYIIPPFAPCPVVTTIHDLSFFRFPESFPVKDRLLLQRFIPFSARKAAHVLTGSESTRRDLLEICGIPGERVTVTPYGVDHIFKPVTQAPVIDAVCEELGIRQPYLLFVGVLQPRKNLLRLLQAYGQLRSEDASAPPLVIAGKRGWMEAEVLNTAESLGLRACVQLVDYVPDHCLPALYSGATALVYPSLYEGFGLPVLEAMACGTPVVTSDVSSMPEVLGDAGILVNPLEVTSIAEGMRRVRSATIAERTEWRQRGLWRASQFSWSRTAALTLAVYRSIAAGQDRNIGN